MNFLALVLALMPILQQSITLHTEHPFCLNEGVLGLYNRQTNELVVCPLAVQTGQSTTVLAHELIHAAQDAADGIRNDTHVALLSDAVRNELIKTDEGQAIQQHIEQYYQPSSYAVEFEAYYFQDTLAGILNE